MALTVCNECGGRVSDTAAACPHCGAPVLRASEAVDTPLKRVAIQDPLIPFASAASSSASGSESNGSAWPWLIGLPIGLLGVFLLVGALQPSNPEKTKDRDVYELCIKDLESLDRGRNSSARTLASMCENMRNAFIKKYGGTP